MKKITINKTSLDKSFTGINTNALGAATGDLTFSGLKLYLYLSGHPDKTVWTFNNTAFASWLGIDVSTEKAANSLRAASRNGFEDLIENKYIKVIGNNSFMFYETPYELSDKKKKLAEPVKEIKAPEQKISEPKTASFVQEQQRKREEYEKTFWNF